MPRYGSLPRRSAVLTLLLLIGLPRLASGQEARIRAAVDTTAMKVGDQITLELVVEHPDGWVVSWPDSLELGVFEVVSSRSGPADLTDQPRSAAQFQITSFELGELEIPSVVVDVVSPEGEVRTLASDRFIIGVESIGLDESGQLRDIKGPLAIPRNWWIVLLWILAASAFFALVGYGVRRWRKRPEVPVALPPPPPPRPFHVLAYEALDALAGSTLLEQGKVKEYHIRLSEIIRSYVEGQLAVPAMELTTSEVVVGLRSAALDPALCGDFRHFLEGCDLVKFAKYRPGSDDSRALLSEGRGLVDRTSGTSSSGRGADEEE